MYDVNLLMRREQRPETVQQLAESIEKMVGDDEILSKIVLAYLGRLRSLLQAGIIPDEAFYNRIFVSHWPYSADPPSLEDFGRTEKCPEVQVPRADIGANERTYLSEIQRQLGRKVKGGELFALCKELAVKTGIRFRKKFQVSKTRALSWLVENSDLIEPCFSSVLIPWIAKQKEKDN
jgi:hypothetical protein